MTEFRPPMSERETNDLIEIVYSPEHWKKEAVTQAKNELEKRGVTKQDQLKILEEWSKEFEEEIKKAKERLENNKTESYSMIEMVLIFFFGPFSLFRLSDRIFTLRDENFYLKFRQRLILLISGSIFWILFVFISYQIAEQKRLDEIDKIDISEWRKIHG
tara:strand:- start:88 stop:567 length:480 start_codon:yes stop_codon:yes gene_type:complete